MVDVDANITMLSHRLGGRYDEDYIKLLFTVHNEDYDLTFQHCVVQLAYQELCILKQKKFHLEVTCTYVCDVYLI